MISNKFMRYIIAILIAIVGLGLTFRPIKDKLDERWLPFVPPKVTKHFVLGYGDVYADSLWLRLLQDIDYCEARQKNETNAQALAAGRICNRGWVFQMLDLISDVAPRFRMAYAIGGIILSVGVNDAEGAKIIFDKGVEQFPRDWPILYRAGFHYMSEIKDLKRAGELYLKAAEYGAPYWVKSLAVRLIARAGYKEYALQVVRGLLSADPEGPASEVLKKRLKEIEENITREETLEKSAK